MNISECWGFHAEVNFMNVVVKLGLVDSRSVKIEIVMYHVVCYIFLHQCLRVVETQFPVSVNPYLNFVVLCSRSVSG